ncbi:Predicted nucleic acid-binding protein, contains PIN domain [Thermosyntropha lipolytica DSM 11003]|uniref:Predicted nucleic acid-binding protein, contains PIN domain n=1 Tax=Thermosyntropha lipolytica DSM 11003 TaxID=1123382 RepID=A0A1M5K282_9FIRM|nr:PIN domain-containing protein [Thermosyntropha lipolytica]SHG46888.1 Predicted nucleic acid-binding protein, contains PIN domain [Thermosyntropha lipolytica DSM 11003]
MKILIDTNVIIDYLVDRMPFADHAEQVLELCRSGKVEGFLTASTITDIYYVVRKAAGREKTLEAIRTLCSILDIADVGKADVLGALELEMKDFEDALIAQCARRIRAECIITRNIADFAASPVPAKEPAVFLSQFD